MRDCSHRSTPKVKWGLETHLCSQQIKFNQHLPINITRAYVGLRPSKTNKQKQNTSNKPRSRILNGRHPLMRSITFQVSITSATRIGLCVQLCTEMFNLLDTVIIVIICIHLLQPLPHCILTMNFICVHYVINIGALRRKRSYLVQPCISKCLA